jgi:hypothetical protein
MPTAIALTATAALLLTACGGSGDDSSDKIAGAGSESSKSASPSASVSASSGTGTPSFDLPSDVKVNFERFKSSDASKQAVLRDTSYAILAWTEGKATGNGTSANIKRYWAGLHGAEVSDSIIKYGKSGKTITGTYREYQPTVSLSGKNGASVTFCEDQSKAYSKNRKTGKIDVTSPSSLDYSLWAMGLAKSSAGDWQVVSYTYTEGAKQCR